MFIIEKNKNYIDKIFKTLNKIICLIYIRLQSRYSLYEERRPEGSFPEF